MPCACPLTGYYAKEVNPKTGKRGITFQRSASFSGVPIRIPCQQCTECRLEHSRQWAMRCMHEKQLYQDNIFITLTYDDKHLPEHGTLVKRDLQLFMKRFRKQFYGDFSRTLRFYACGEYGDKSFRPHYHAIMFNVDLPDKKFYKNTPAGFPLYTSEYLRKSWPMGNNIVGDVDFDSCAYVARYIMKKIKGEGADDYYERYNLSTGEIVRLQPEFTNMSRRPGIGREWFAKYGSHAYNFDSVIMNGQEVRPPRYYDGLYDAIDAKKLAEIKLKRRRVASSHRADNTPDRRRVREQVVQARLALKGRII